MAATVATVLALAVAIESTAVLSAAVAIVAVAAASVLSIFQVAVVVWSPRPTRGRPVIPDRRRARVAPATPHIIGRQAGLGGRAFVRAPAGGRGSGLRVSAQLQAGRRCMDPRARCARSALSLGWGARMQWASGCKMGAGEWLHCGRADALGARMMMLGAPARDPVQRIPGSVVC